MKLLQSNIWQVTHDEESSFHESQGYEQIIHTTTDLFFAGSETTSSTLAFAILFMVREPEVQDKVTKCKLRPYTRNIF